MQGFSIVGTASNGEEAIEMFKAFKKKPDIIIMDHRMPLKDGLEATKEILLYNHKVKIIIASADKSIGEKALQLGAIKFLTKPFRMDTLIKCIKESTSA